jgi:Family of unknown function (DUF5317)
MSRQDTCVRRMRLGTVSRVTFFVLTLVAAVLIVLATKGSFRRLGRIQFRILWLLFVALGIQIVLEYVTFPKDRIDDLGLATLLLSYVLIFVFCYVNKKVKGMTLIAIGIALNVLVIVLNQGMPTKDDVHERNGREVHVPIERTVKHRPQDDDTLLPFLGDIMTLPGARNTQFSIGDIVIALGIVDVCFEASRVPRRRGVSLPT